MFYLIQSLRKKAAESMHKLQKAESEAKTLRTMTQMMILTHEEMVCFILLFVNSVDIDKMISRN